MKNLTKLAAAVALTGVAFSVQAAPITVLGVTWDPDSTVPLDFSGQHEFTQWFVSGASSSGGLGVNDLNGFPSQADAINPTTITVGDVLVGTAKVSSINGNEPYNPPASNPFCGDPAACELTYVFGGFTVSGFEPTTSNPIFTGGWVNMYSGPVPPFYNGSTGATPALAADGQLFLQLQAEAYDPDGVGPLSATTLAFTSGTITNGGVEAFLNATGGAAQPNFDTDSQDFDTDVRYLGNATFLNSANEPQNISQEGNGQWFADTVAVPEPSVLMLLGAGLAGIGITRRKTAKRA